MRLGIVLGERAKAVDRLKGITLVFLFVGAWPASAQEVKTPYATMAPLDQYLMEDRGSEIALARSAAPESISRDAEALVLGKHGYEPAAPGRNGFVCLVQRSWAASADDPEFWNPKLRAPICFNAPAVRSYLRLILKKTELVLAGNSKAEIAQAISTAIDKKELPGMEPGAIGYMQSKQGYLNDHVGHWHPHLMFFVAHTDAAAWGADLPGSPILTLQDGLERLTMFLIPVRAWSDGTHDGE